MPFPSRHIFKCYQDSTDDFEIVEASSHEEAAVEAAMRRRHWSTNQVITRYLITRTAGKYEHPVRKQVAEVSR